MGMKNKWDKYKTNSKVVDLNSTLNLQGLKDLN